MSSDISFDFSSKLRDDKVQVGNFNERRRLVDKRGRVGVIMDR
jgi:hypothetical protein